jgi:hypothetical protein
MFERSADLLGGFLTAAEWTVRRFKPLGNI